MPLLHTWSLTLEEQSYLIFPLILIFTARRLGSRYAAVLWWLAAASFAVSLWSVAFAPRAAFFLLPARLWELLAGAIVALPARPTAARSRRDAALSIAGLALIAAAVFGFTMTTPFPGASALVPCAGTALVLRAGVSTEPLMNRALGWTPLAWIGRISYSLYLWHWPMYVLAPYALARPLTAIETVWVTACSIGVAAISWRYIEQPFRRSDGVLPRRPLFAASEAAVAATVALGLAVVSAGGVRARFSGETLAILAEDVPALTCDRVSMAGADLEPLCAIGSRAAKAPSFVVWGDSHAGALLPAVEEAALEYGLAGELSALNDCPPLLGLERARWSDRSCAHRNDAMVQHLRTTGIRTVILAARWASGLEVSGEIAGRAHLSWQYDQESRERSLVRTAGPSIEACLARSHVCATMAIA
jgi:hypothetical protein